MRVGVGAGVNPARVLSSRRAGLPAWRALSGRVSTIRAELREWYVIGPLAYVVMPGPVPPRGGLYGTWLGRREVSVRLRSGFTIRCRLDEFDGVLSAFLRREYDVPGVGWEALRTIVDVGANVGAATLWFAARAPAARIVAVEPSPDAVGRLSANLTRNRLDDRVRVVPAALGGRSGVAHLGPATTSVGARTLGAPVPGSTEVPLTTLDDILDSNTLASVDLLKLDCEGAEYEILLSAPQALLRRIGTIVGEYHAVDGHRPEELVNCLERSGFVVNVAAKGEQGLFLATRV